METTMPLFNWPCLCCLALSLGSKLRFTKLPSVRPLDPLQCLQIKIPLGPMLIIRDIMGHVGYWWCMLGLKYLQVQYFKKSSLQAKWKILVNSDSRFVTCFGPKSNLYLYHSPSVSVIVSSDANGWCHLGDRHPFSEGLSPVLINCDKGGRWWSIMESGRSEAAHEVACK